MSRIFKRDDLGDKLLRIRPEGWVHELVFEYGYLYDSGQAVNSIGVRINNEAGGVLTNDDLMAILNMIVGHLKRVAQETDTLVNDLVSEHPEGKLRTPSNPPSDPKRKANT